ncbi:MAG: type III polyketide synthase [Bacteroidota bacterium]
MSKIAGIGIAVPPYKMQQGEIHRFMEKVYDAGDDDKRKLKMLYERSGIATRYSVVPDYNEDLNTRMLFPDTGNLEPFPSLEKRMELYHRYAGTLAVEAINKLRQCATVNDVTHLITVSCTGLSAPGLDLELMERLGLPNHIQRSAVNFMGCYAAVHALKQADAICNSSAAAKVLIVSVELCTLHFQKKTDYDNLTANAIFGDGAAACLVVSDDTETGSGNAVHIKGFYSEVHHSAKKDMAWQLSSSGFLMTLSSYIPQLVESNIEQLVTNAMDRLHLSKHDIAHWAIHPGGRKILEAISGKLALEPSALQYSYEVLNEYGNMSSATLLFVLKKMIETDTVQGTIFGAAFGPGLTMETVVLDKH